VVGKEFRTFGEAGVKLSPTGRNPMTEAAP